MLLLFRADYFYDSTLINYPAPSVLGTSEALDKNFVKDLSLWRMIFKHRKTPLSLPTLWSQAGYAFISQKFSKSSHRIILLQT